MPLDRLDVPRYVWQMLNGFRLRHERRFWHLRHDDLALYVNWQQPLCVLDLANGRLRPQYTLLSSEGHRVYGLDLINRPESSLNNMGYLIARALFDRRIGVVASRSERRLVCGNVNTMPFADNTFDLITSIAAFEHFLNVPRVVLEARRVLKSGGLIWVVIHLFSSPSGGHNVSLTQIPLKQIPSGAEPWDHLRQRRLPFHVSLNEWRIDQYLAEFSKHFEIVNHYCAMREGEEYLTPAIEAELADYSRDELTCVAYIIVARKLHKGAQHA